MIVFGDLERIRKVEKSGVAGGEPQKTKKPLKSAVSGRCIAVC
jgi:hypothetical protein